MSTTATHGKSGYVEIQLPGTSTWLNITDKCHNAASAFNRDTSDTSTFGTGDKTYVGGMRDGTLTIDYYTDPALRDILFTCWLSDTACKIRSGPEGNATGKERQMASFFVTSFGDGGGISGVIGSQAQCQRTGSTTRDTWP